jgi:NodT family efflux transporter outer membrane factor (OMF) lipoprotein
LQAQVEFRRYQLEGTYLALTSNIVTTAVREAALREQMRATEQIVASQRAQLSLTRGQLKLGAATRAQLLTQQTELAQTVASLPALEKELALTRHRLAVLSGRFPGDPTVPEFRLDGFSLPDALPISLPSTVARQRPDIRAAEAVWHQASAQLGVATANLYPRLTLNASFGPQSNDAGELFHGGANIWSASASLLQPLFHGGELKARKRVAVAAYDQAGAQYRETLLTAFQNVADVLRTLESDTRALTMQAEADTLAQQTLALVQKQYELGAANFPALLDAQRQYQRVHINFVQAQAARYADTAALFQALGGGWWNRTPEQTDVVTTGARKQP